MAIDRNLALESLTNLYANKPEFQAKLKEVINNVIDKKMSYEQGAAALSINPQIQGEIVQMFKLGREAQYIPDLASVLYPHFATIKALQKASAGDFSGGGGKSGGGGASGGW